MSHARSFDPSAHVVRKIQLWVRAQCLGAEPVEGHVALAQRSAFHDGPQTLLERLNEETRVVPIRRSSDGVVLLLTRAQMACVEAAPEQDSALIGPRLWLVTREERVEVELVDGRVLEGRIPMELPQDFNRASDFINSEEGFFALVQPASTFLVNKSCVRHIAVLDPPPAPPPAPELRLQG